eukprot:scaffold2462_cov402-Prasinococcus_capsulatus_cf.AAC.5
MKHYDGISCRVPRGPATGTLRLVCLGPPISPRAEKRQPGFRYHTHRCLAKYGSVPSRPRTDSTNSLPSSTSCPCVTARFQCKLGVHVAALGGGGC